MTPLRLKRLEQGIGWGLLLIVAVMPFHAFLSVWLGSLVGHHSLIQAWKELLTLVLVVATGCLVYLEPERLQALKRPLFYVIGGFVSVALVVTLVTPHSGSSAIFGIKTDLEYIVLFAIAYIVATKELKYRLVKIIIVTSIVVSLIGLVLAFLLPPTFLEHFGYGPTTILPYLTLDPALHAIRTPSTLGGANQLGAFLILPLCLVFGLMVRRFRWWQPLTLLICAGGAYVSYSRSAWVGAIVGLVATLLLSVSRKRAIILATALGVVMLAGWVAVASQLQHDVKLQYYLLHTSATQSDQDTSTFLHGKALSAGLQAVVSHPIGQGLGTAGPSSFHGTAAFIPENYYLQIAIETGLVGLALYLTFVVLVGYELFKHLRIVGIGAGLLGALIGISVVNLVLHGWADSTLAFIFWILAGTVLGEVHRRV